MAEIVNDPVLLLIRSLTTGEKNHFQRSVTKGGDNKYLTLFNIIETMPEAGEKEIQTAYKRKAGNIGQYARIKAYLYQRLIESLADYHTRHVPRVEIHELLKQAEVLLLKQLRGPLRDVLKRARLLIEDSGAMEMMPELIWREKTSIPIDLSPDETRQQITKLNIQLNESLNTIHELHDVGDLSFMLAMEANNEFRFSPDEYRERLKALTSHPVFNKELSEFTNERVRISALSMRAFYCLAVSDFEGYIVEVEKMFQILRSSEKASTEHYLRYANNLSNIILAFPLLNRAEEALPYLEEYENLLQLLGSMGFREKYNPLYLIYLVSKARIMFALDRFPQVIELQSQFFAIESAISWSSVNNWRRHQFLMLLAGAYLIDGQTKIATRILARMINDEAARKYPFAEELRQFEFAICYETGDEDRMESLLASMKRKQNKTEHKSIPAAQLAYDAKCLSGWTEVLQHRGNEAAIKQSFKRMRKALLEVHGEKPDHNERSRFVFERWLIKMEA
ncbi:MAG: hypothetical protein ACK5Z2_00275 [Bacteroidota bacterium]